MSKLNELIQRYCPNGVEYKSVGSCLDYEQPTKYLVESTSYDDSYSIPVLTAGQTFILGYTNETNGIYHADAKNPVIIFDDFTTASKWVDFDFKAKSSAMKMLKSADSNTYNIRYIFHCMQNLKYVPSDHARQWISKYGMIEIPVPPLPVQEEIVRILDKFTELEAELEAELEMRKKQYEYYRNKLISEADNVEWTPIGEIGDIIRGKRFVHKDDVNEGVPAIHYGELYTYYGISAVQTKTNIRSELGSKMRYAHTGDVVIVGAGENKTDIGVGVAWMGKEDVAVHDACFILTNHNQNPKYISYCLRTEDYHKKLFKFVSEGKICSFLKEGLAQVTIPIPKDINEQNRIVYLLDKFNSLTDDISNGLPSEIKMRHQQYEYYRDYIFSILKEEIVK